jgi:diguanylate cyclase (GGDEF)-like protein/PAS domain S-box-containing protein
MEPNMDKTPLDAVVASILHESDSLLLALFNNTIVGVYVFDNTHFLYVSPRFAEMHGYTQDEIIDQGLITVAPDDRWIVQREIDLRIKSKVKIGSHYGFRAMRKDGTLFECEVYGAATQFAGQSAIIGLMLDISTRRATERAVMCQLNLIEKLINTIPNPVYYKDEHDLYLGCNAAFEQLIGHKREELIGHTPRDFYPKDLADAYIASDMLLFEQRGKQTYEATITYATDSTRHDMVFYKATFDKADGSLGGLVGVLLDISDRKRMEEASKREANYDILTGLPNRRSFFARLGDELKRAQRNHCKLALLFIDLDHFKEVNDTLGHDLGDQLLVQASQRISSIMRASDAVFRQGGDEFLVFLPDLTDSVAAGSAAQKIIDELSLSFDLNGQQAYVTASVGIAIYPDDSSGIETLISYADQAMYAAKALGRKCFCYFEQPMQAQALHRIDFVNNLRQAVIEKQFEVYYQPIVDMTNGRTVKAEALVRWNHPEHGLVSPTEFLPIAEEIGIVANIGNWAFHQAMDVAHQWQLRRAAEGEAKEPIQIGVNLWPHQFVDGTCDNWIDCLRQLNLPAHTLVVGITEGLLLDVQPAVIDALLSFHAAGVQISLHNFGAGNSAISYLRKSNIDYLKIDRTYVCDLATNQKNCVIAGLLITMAHKLGVKAIAEGVETEEQRKILSQARCDYMQGDLFAKPMTLADFQCYAGF